jgi:GrpB-like predicted nucleotidyltransferase (UPF0157 family)
MGLLWQAMSGHTLTGATNRASSYAAPVPDPQPSPARAVVVPHDPAWTTVAAAITGELLAALAPLALRVEHIGSTAIPGMAAKPVLDLQVSVEDLDEAAGAFDGPLAERGFHRLAYQDDHVPAGRAPDPAGWAKRLWARRDHPGGNVNLHVRRRGAANERVALLFRDWFRAHPEAVASYARFKRVLADAVDDADTYTDVKGPVVDLVIAVAEPWAAATGWNPSSSSA